MAFVAYRYDEQARQEAADHPVDEGDAGWLREQCTRKTAELGDGGVRGHTVSFSVTAWDQPPGLPDSVAGTGHISHGEVLDIGERLRTGTLLATELIAASFAWDGEQLAMGHAAIATSVPPPGTSWICH